MAGDLLASGDTLDSASLLFCSPEATVEGANDGSLGLYVQSWWFILVTYANQITVLLHC